MSKGDKNEEEGSIDVAFISLWDGNIEIKTPAKLNLATGEIHNIKVQDVESYDLTTLGLESIRIDGIDEDFDAIEDYCGMEYAVDACSLNKINELVKKAKQKLAEERDAISIKVLDVMIEEVKTYEKKYKIVYCDCCDSAWIKIEDKGQDTYYACTMCRENEPDRFAPNTEDCYDCIDCGN